MNFDDLLKNNNLVNKLNKTDLKKIYEEGKEKYNPIQDTLFSISKRIREIEKEEYLKNRDIKYYPVLNELLSKIGEKYKDLLIDLDEYMSTTILSNFSSYKLFLIIENRNIKDNILKEEILDFLIDNNVITPCYEYICSNCNEIIFTFNHYPTEEELHKQIDDSVCDNCDKEIDFDFNDLQISDYYNFVNKVNRKK